MLLHGLCVLRAVIRLVLILLRLTACHLPQINAEPLRKPLDALMRIKPETGFPFK